MIKVDRDHPPAGSPQIGVYDDRRSYVADELVLGVGGVEDLDRAGQPTAVRPFLDPVDPQLVDPFGALRQMHPDQSPVIGDEREGEALPVVGPDVQHHLVLVLRPSDPVQLDHPGLDRVGLRSRGTAGMRHRTVEVGPIVRQPGRRGELGLDRRIVLRLAGARVDQHEVGPVAATLTALVAQMSAVVGDGEAAH